MTLSIDASHAQPPKLIEVWFAFVRDALTEEVPPDEANSWWRAHVDGWTCPHPESGCAKLAPELVWRQAYRYLERAGAPAFGPDLADDAGMSPLLRTLITQRLTFYDPIGASGFYEQLVRWKAADAAAAVRLREARA